MNTDARAATRGVPHVLTGALFLMWLLLNDSLSLGHVVLGLLLAVALSRSSRVLRPARARIRRPHLALLLLWLVFVDVLRSNLGVARIVLGLRRAQSGFVKIPLELTDSHGLAVLATIVTATPGTVWADHDAAARVLTLHVLDLTSEQEWIDWIKSRYERLLMEIFE
jgi:multicomponent K+:H+ antiporter subunit E